MKIQAIAVLGLVMSCGGPLDGPTLTSIVQPLPQALLADCENPPDDLQAELWVSGNVDPCPLEVSVADGTASGTCTLPAGRDRTVTLDYYVLRQGIRVMIAQARKRFSLATADAEITWQIADADLKIAECLDVSRDPLNGSDTQVVGGNPMPACDLNGSCLGSPAIECSNLGDLCAGDNPL